MNGHIIHKQKFTLKYKGKTNAFSLQKNAEDFCSKILLPKIELLFDNYATTEELQIDTLNVDVNANGIDDLNETFADRIVAQLKNNLQLQLDAKPTSRKEIESPGLLSLLTQIAVKGYVASSNQQKDFIQLLDDWLNKPGDIPVEKIATLLRKSLAVERMTFILNEKQYWHLFQRIIVANRLSIVAKDDVQNLQRDLAAFRKHTQFFLIKCGLLHAVLTSQNLQQMALWFLIHPQFKNVEPLIISKQKWNSVLFPQLIKEIKNLENDVRKPGSSAKTSNGKTKSNITSTPLENEVIYAANAGMVIVAPFLEKFFRNIYLKIEGEKEWARALHILQFIAAGTDALDPLNLVLPKVLLNIPLDAFVLPGYQLEENERSQVHELLTSVIEHWKVLKNTSVDGLRYNFLQRAGSMHWGGSSWKLKVESETHDILLDKLPWNISMIKLPWMSALLEVDWR